MNLSVLKSHVARLATRLLFFGLPLYCLSFKAEVQASQAANPFCLLQKCLSPLLGCALEPECSQWLQCVLACGEDNIRCPTICGLYHRSRVINHFNSCIFGSECVDFGFAKLPHLPLESMAGQNLSGLEGDYWLMAEKGGPQVFNFPCQKFSFKSRGTDLDVLYGVPINLGKGSRYPESAGSFERNPDLSYTIKYDSFVGYHERWKITHRLDTRAFQARVCIDEGERCADYATLILSSVPEDTLSLDDRSALGWDQSFNSVKTHCDSP